MIEIVYSPAWFYGKDIIIDLVSILVLSFIVILCAKYYKMDSKNKNYFYLAIASLLLAFSFLFKILTNFTIYYTVLEKWHLGIVTYAFNDVHSTNILFFIGFLLYRVLTLLGLYVLYEIYQKDHKRSQILLIIYLLLVMTYFSSSAYYIFHITSFMLLLMLTSQYFKNYRKNKQHTTKLLACSFGTITASQLVFIFVQVNAVLYVIAEAVQLAGYIILLITLMMVLKYGKKKR
ncbi:MAG: hypothetical protein NT001_04455 [Candidatus Woesearchaeota archaeon]|nr:hypothetical protein [Candidatus Woesearchaeota archaeon]